VSILGPRYTHGHIFDFYSQLLRSPGELLVLGNGRQRKSYLHVTDCVSAIQHALAGSFEQINIFNLGLDSLCEVRDSIGWIIDELGLNPKVIYGNESKGWVGDNPLIHLRTSRIESLGWKPKYSIEDSVRDTVKYMKSNHWLFERFD
jgi:UDP-glucose 4-epimerase